MARILIPLPDTDFDTTEAAAPWRLLARRLIGLLGEGATP